MRFALDLNAKRNHCTPDGKCRHPRTIRPHSTVIKEFVTRNTRLASNREVTQSNNPFGDELEWEQGCESQSENLRKDITMQARIADIGMQT